MARRPIYIPNHKGREYQELVKAIEVDFTWYPGFAKIQARKSIRSLHTEAKREGIYPVLEISSKSEEHIGRQLSAFNLKLDIDKLKLSEKERIFKNASRQESKVISVEAAYQGSKFFEKSGPLHDLYSKPIWKIKKDSRLKKSGRLKRFDFFGKKFPIDPPTAFYDWLYLQALDQNPELVKNILDYKGFSDIAFNPKKSINCQAKAAALFICLKNKAVIREILDDEDEYISFVKGSRSKFMVGHIPVLTQRVDSSNTNQLELLSPSWGSAENYRDEYYNGEFSGSKAKPLPDYLNQKQLAIRLGVSPKTIRRSRYNDNLKELAITKGVNEDWYYSESESTKREKIYRPRKNI